MRKNDLFGAAVATILQNKRRSISAVIVCALGLGCLLVMMALGTGGQEQFMHSISGNDATEIRVTQSGPSGSALDDGAIASFKGIEGVSGATGVITLPVQIKSGRYTAQSIDVMAVDPAVLGKLSFALGGLFSTQSSAPQLVLGYSAQMLFNTGSANGQTDGSDTDSGQGAAAPTPPPVDWLSQSVQIIVGGAAQGGDDKADMTAGVQTRSYTGNITGILKQDKSDRDGLVLMNLAVAKKMVRDNYAWAASLGVSADSYTTALVFAKDIDSVKAVTDQITAMGYAAASAVADLEGLQTQLGLQQTLLVVNEISAVLVALFIMAIILQGSTQPDFGAVPGVYKSASKKVRLLASVLLGFAGGVAGVLLSCFFALITNTSSTETVVFYMHFGQTSNLSIPLLMALETVVISPFIGLLAEALVAMTLHRDN